MAKFNRTAKNGCPTKIPAESDKPTSHVLSTILLKTEPSEYSFADLQRDVIAVWDGVSNPAAVKHLREMKPRGETCNL